jgi:uncharacterized membrane protein
VPRIEERIHIDRPVAEVFAFNHDPGNQTLINANYESFELDGPMEKGAQPRGVTRVAGKKVAWSSEVVAYDRDRRVEIQSLDAPMEFHIVWDYASDDGGTEVSFVQDVPSLGGFFGRLSDPVVVKMYARNVRSNLESLKVLLEEGADR